MAETQIGVAKIFGLGAGALATLSGAATLTMENADFEHKCKMDESKGQTGEVETVFFSDEQYEISINFMPKGASRAAAISQAANLIPALGTKVTLSGFDIARYNGDYNYIGGGTIKLVRDKECVMGMKLRAWITNRVSLTAGVLA